LQRVFLRLDFGDGIEILQSAPLAEIAVLLAATIAVAPIPALAQDQRAPAKQQKKITGGAGQAAESRRRSHARTGLSVRCAESGAGSGQRQACRSADLGAVAADPSDTAALLMMRAKAAMDAQQMDVALKLLDAVVKLRPDYVEGWNRRATLYYLQNDYAHSLEDIEQVLVREPRHFGALAGLGMIMQDLGDEKRALDAFRKALAVNPYLDKVAGTGQDPGREGRRPRHLIACEICCASKPSIPVQTEGTGSNAGRSLMQGVAAALERAAMRHDRVELRQFRLQMLVDHQQRFQRATDVAVAARHNFVNCGFIRSGNHRKSSNPRLNRNFGINLWRLARSLWIYVDSADNAASAARARHVASGQVRVIERRR